MVLGYNTSMGGVDLADMLIALYGTKIMVKKRWYFKVIFTHWISARLMGGYFIVVIVISKQFQKAIKIHCLHSFQSWLGHSGLQENQIQNWWKDLKVDFCL